MIWTVAFLYLLHPFHIRDPLPSRTGRHITKDERVVGRRNLLRELSKQNIRQAAYPRLIDGTRVMGDQTRQPVIYA